MLVVNTSVFSQLSKKEAINHFTPEALRVIQEMAPESPYRDQLLGACLSDIIAQADMSVPCTTMAVNTDPSIAQTVLLTSDIIEQIQIEQDFQKFQLDLASMLKGIVDLPYGSDQFQLSRYIRSLGENEEINTPFFTIKIVDGEPILYPNVYKHYSEGLTPEPFGKGVNIYRVRASQPDKIFRALREANQMDLYKPTRLVKLLSLGVLIVILSGAIIGCSTNGENPTQNGYTQIAPTPDITPTHTLVIPPPTYTPSPTFVPSITPTLIPTGTPEPITYTLLNPSACQNINDIVNGGSVVPNVGEMTFWSTFSTNNRLVGFFNDLINVLKPGNLSRNQFPDLSQCPDIVIQYGDNAEKIPQLASFVITPDFIRSLENQGKFMIVVFPLADSSSGRLSAPLKPNIDADGNEYFSSVMILGKGGLNLGNAIQVEPYPVFANSVNWIDKPLETKFEVRPAWGGNIPFHTIGLFNSITPIDVILKELQINPILGPTINKSFSRGIPVFGSGPGFCIR